MMADLVDALRCAAAAVPEYSATFIEAADEIERLRRELAAQTLVVTRLMGLMPEHDTRESYRCTECGAFHLRPAADSACEHEWVSARNEVVTSGEICKKCFAIRAEQTQVTASHEHERLLLVAR